MRTLFRNARILTFEDECAVEGDLVTDGDRIVYLGGEYGGAADRTVDCEGDVLMPSLVDTHAHLGMTTMRGLADDLPLADWLHDRIFPMEARLDGELVRAGARLGLAELILGGVTGVADMYLYPEIMFDLLTESGVEGIVACGDSDGDGDTLRRLARQERTLALRNDRVKGMLSFHAEYTCSDAYLDGILELSQTSRTGVMTHNSETLAEVGDCANRRGGLTPTAALHNMGLFDYGGLVAHCVHCDKDDLALLAQSGVAISVNCASNCKLGSGIPNIFAMKCGGNLVTLGTDSAASNNRLDLWREMYLAAVLPKAILNTADAVTARDVLGFATANGARVIGSQGGKLCEGGIANMIRVSLHAPSVTPIGSDESALVYAGSADYVRMTMCRGRILAEDGRLCNGWDLDGIRRDAVAAAKRIAES